MATESQVFVLVRVSVNATLVRVSLVQVTRNWHSCQYERALMVC